MEIVKIKTEFIKLDQLLKWIDVVSSGVEAKIVIQDGMVKLNGEIETRRGKKIYDGDIIEFEDKKYKIIRE
ncbi:MAG: RNA-binding protein [Fusobacteriales bacterium]|jgi:ribosome-associated protein|nr:RNA-binding protein [Fusobacteriales bacterium]